MTIVGQLKPRPGLPFSRPIRVDKIPEDGADLEIDATQQECAAIAAAADLPAVSALSARFRIDRQSGRRYEVSGELRARFSQICVVTLDAFDTDLSRPIDIMFAEVDPPATVGKGRRDVSAEPASVPLSTDGEDDPPDPVVDGIIDLGDIAFEFLLLARDLYPRKPGVEFSDITVGESEEREPSPFIALQSLKDRP